jgi:helix-turn-helix protein
MHAIGVLDGLTLLEFDGTSQEAPEVQQPKPEVQEVQLIVEELGEVVVECSDHKPCNFVKGKPQSIISLLISEIQLKYYVIYLLH